MENTKWFTYLLAILLLVIFLLLLLLPSNVVSVVKADEEPPVEVPRDNLDRLIDQLAYCESRNNEKAINPHDPDTASYGLLQFKTDTFFRYNLVYGILPNLERAEVANVIFDGEIQRQLAKEIIKDGGWKNWYNCLKKYFL